MSIITLHGRIKRINLFFLAYNRIWGILQMVVLCLDSIGAEFPLKNNILEFVAFWLTGRHATDTREPRQVRKEAAISDGVCVMDRSRFCFLSYGLGNYSRRVHSRSFGRSPPKPFVVVVSTVQVFFLSKGRARSLHR